METFKRVLSYARPYGRSVPGYLLLSVLSVVFGVMNYGLLGPLLSVLFEDPAVGAALARPRFAWSLDYVTGLFSWMLSSVIHRGGVIRGLLFVCGALVVSCLLANVCRYLSQRILVVLETRLMKNLREALFDKILSLPVGWFTNRRKGDVLSSISNDVAEVQSGVAGSFHAFFRQKSPRLRQHAHAEQVVEDQPAHQIFHGNVVGLAAGETFFLLRLPERRESGHGRAGKSHMQLLRGGLVQLLVSLGHKVDFSVLYEFLRAQVHVAVIADRKSTRLNSSH